MLIENIMYFALGVLIAGLVALIILPAVWKRAVRLTKRRIEAATPITMAEFRADKDQLRAEFALSTRRLEMSVEALRKRLAEQLGNANQQRSDMGTFKAELRTRILELEHDGKDLAQQLRDGELEVRNGELEKLRDTVRGDLPKGTDLDGKSLTGDYDEDIDRLTTALVIERKRAAFLEGQASSLVDRLENSDGRSAETAAAIAGMRAALAHHANKKAADAESLIAAEASIANAENQLNSLLAETGQIVEQSNGRAKQLLADKLSLEAEVECLRQQVVSVEPTILADWDNGRVEEAYLREKLNDIATSVSRLVYAADTETPVVHTLEESLFDRVRRFADDGQTTDIPPTKPAKGNRKGSVSDRMAALKKIQGR